MASLRAGWREGSIPVLVLFAGVCCAPLVLLLVHAAHTHTTFSGVGAGLSLGDQFRYLAWVRDAAGHGLIGGIAGPQTAAHTYFNPLFMISGLLHLAGVSVQFAYLVWLPISLVALFFGYRALIWRVVPAGAARPAALALALMASSPLMPLLDYGGITDNNQNWSMITLATHLPAFWQAWGYFPAALALALAPLYVLAVRDALATGGRPLRRLVVTGFLVALLSPTAGLVLAVLTAMFLVRRPRVLGAGLAALLLPLVYYLVLSLVCSDWTLGNLRQSFTFGSAWTFLAVFGPLLVVAAFAWPEPDDPTDALLWCWLAASALAFVVLGSDSRLAALEGTSVPIAILAVKGWRRRRWPALVSLIALALAIVPGAAYAGATFHDYVNDDYGPFTLTYGERQALRALPAGGVLATPWIAPAVPVFGGTRISVPPTVVSVPNASSRTLDDLFDGRLDVARARAIVASSGAIAVLSDCRAGRAPLAPVLQALGFRARQFGCAAVWVRARATA